MTVLVRAEFSVPDADRAAFADVARELAAAGAAEPGTVQYRWFVPTDPSVFVVIEEYVDEAAAFAHNEACAPLLERVFGIAELTRIEIHGELGDALRQWIDERPQAAGFVPLT